MNYSDRLLNNPVKNLLLIMSVQCAAALIFYGLFSMADIYFVSKWVGEYAAGGVTASTPLLLALSALSVSAGTGGASVVSRAIGKKEYERAARCTANVFMTFWLAAVLTTLFGLFFLDDLLAAMGAEGELLPYAKQYSRIILCGAIASTGFSALIRAEGATRFSLLIWLIPVSINIAGDVLFMRVFGWGVRGAALSTIICQTASLLMSMWFFFIRKNRTYRIQIKHFKPEFTILKEVFGVGLPSLLNLGFSALLLAAINKLLMKNGGADAVTAFGFAMKVMLFLQYFQSGIAQAVQPITGSNLAANKNSRVLQAHKLALIYSVAAGIIVCAAVLLAGRSLIDIFSRNKTVAAAGVMFLSWLSFSTPVKGISPLAVAIYQSAGRKTASTLMIICAFIIQLVCTVVLSTYFGLKGILYADLASSILVAVLAAVCIIIKPVAKGGMYEECNEVCAR